ncbi:MAG: methyl-accepting chemotaxis protein [Treponema sp.]|nr:methyl-accepting chemotaxis protein [Treponema sp.]
MFNSIKSKILVPVVGLMVLVLAAVVLYAVVGLTKLAGDLTGERIATVSQVAYTQISGLDARNRASAYAVAHSENLAGFVRNWNGGGDQDGIRQDMLAYLADWRTELGVDSFIVYDPVGTVILRTHDFSDFGDNARAARHVAAALRGETFSLYSSTESVPMGLTAAVPIKDGNTVIGVIAAVLYLHTDRFVQEISDSFNAEVTVFAGYTRVATTVIDRSGQKVVGTDMDDRKILDAVMVRGESYTTELDLFGVPHMGYYFPLKGSDNLPIGMFFVGFSNERTESLAGTSKRDMIVFSVVGVLLVAAGIFFLVSRLIRPLHVLAGRLNDIANGEGDLTVRIPEAGNDEVAKVSRHFNQTIEKIRALVLSIKERAVTLSDIGSDLTSNMTETAAAMNQIVANIQSIKVRVVNQSASVTETNATMEQVTENIGKLGESVQRQTYAVSQSSSAIEEMLANIQSVTNTLKRNAANMNELKESSNSGRTSVQEVAGDIREIARESEGLMEINAVMENIASQTNLLSMNAAIEAAHAGDSGKGFAVVADEIRKLAESSGEQSKTIGTVLQKIKASIEKITRSTDDVLQKFEAIDHGVRTVAEQEDVIRSAMEEQGEGSRQVLQSATQVSEITGQVKGGSVQMLEGSQEVIKESRNLELVTQEITNGMNEMAVGADEINRAVNNVSDLSVRNRQNISVLVEEVSKFKV